jgi:multiple sugar transport system permease protein
MNSIQERNRKLKTSQEKIKFRVRSGQGKWTVVLALLATVTAMLAINAFARFNTSSGILFTIQTFLLLYVFFLFRIPESLVPRYLILPTTMVLIALTIFPMVYLMYLSVHDVTVANLRGEHVFVGVKNYVAVLKDTEVIVSFFRTIQFLICVITLELVIGMAMAFLLYQEYRETEVLTTLFMLPVMVSPILVGMMWRYMFSFNDGFINQLLSSLGLQKLPWLTNEPIFLARLFSNPAWATNFLNLNFGFMSVLITDIWQWTPFVTLLILAGLKSLPSEPFEAAMVDGASTWQTMRYIAIPLLKPSILVALLIRLMDSMKAFDTIWALFEGSLFTRVLNLSLYNIGITRKLYSQGAALSVLIIVFVTFLTQMVLKTLRVAQES